MWVFIPGGFVSIVAHREIRGDVLVRARRREDLERFLSVMATLDLESRVENPLIEETPSADYPFRIKIDQGTVAELLAAHAQAIDYDNFKAASGNEDRQHELMKVWLAMRDLQYGVPAT